MKRYKQMKTFLIEDSLYFGDKNRVKKFNKKKIILHRASMKYYYDYLTKEGFSNITYIDYNKNKTSYSFLKPFTNIHLYDPVDHLLVQRLHSLNKKLIVNEETPMFMLTQSDTDEYLKEVKSKNKFFHKHFYEWQLKKHKIPFIKRSYDIENRASIPSSEQIPSVNDIIGSNDNDTQYVKDAIKYVNKHCKTYYGNTSHFFYPVTHKTAKKWVDKFIKSRLCKFGTYQDAITEKHPFLFHSMLSACMNIGLITPKDVTTSVIEYYKKNKSKVKINNFEGFIRQIIGWREYMRLVYVHKYESLVSSNFFNNKKKLDKRWYSGSLGVHPVDMTIKRRLIQDIYIT